MERHGLSRPSATVATHAVGRLTPMAFLVGVSVATHSLPPSATTARHTASNCAAAAPISNLATMRSRSCRPISWRCSADRSRTAPTAAASAPGSSRGTRRAGSPMMVAASPMSVETAGTPQAMASASTFWKPSDMRELDTATSKPGTSSSSSRRGPRNCTRSARAGELRQLRKLPVRRLHAGADDDEVRARPPRRQQRERLEQRGVVLHRVVARHAADDLRIRRQSEPRPGAEARGRHPAGSGGCRRRCRSSRASPSDTGRPRAAPPPASSCRRCGAAGTRARCRPGSRRASAGGCRRGAPGSA